MPLIPHSIWGKSQKSVGANAITLGSDAEFKKAPTKLFRIYFDFLSNNTTTGYTVANVMTQLGSTFILSGGSKIGNVVDILQMADLFYLEWYLRKKSPHSWGSTTNNTIAGLVMDLWMGRPNMPNEGLPPTELSLQWTLPADANEVDSKYVEIVQWYDPHAIYNKGLIYQQLNGPAPSTSVYKDFDFPVVPPNALLDDRILDLIYQTTGARTTTDTTTIEQIALQKDGVFIGEEFNADSFFATSPAGNEEICGVAGGFVENYLPIDWVHLLGHPFNLKANGVTKRYGINLLGGDTNAIRVLSHALKTWGA
jgi:hypothetical protein